MAEKIANVAEILPVLPLRVWLHLPPK